jgi:hypothetical protein
MIDHLLGRPSVTFKRTQVSCEPLEAMRVATDIDADAWFGRSKTLLVRWTRSLPETLIHDLMRFVAGPALLDGLHHAGQQEWSTFDTMAEQQAP